MNELGRPERITMQMCNALGLPGLNLHTVLYENNNRNFYIYKDGHFNKEGHA